MPLDEREEALFRSIEAELRAEDPEFAARLSGASRWQGSLWRLAWPGLGLLAGLLVLPLAAHLGVYPVGLLGYVLATFAAVAIWRQRGYRALRLPRPGRRAEAGSSAEHPDAEAHDGHPEMGAAQADGTRAPRPWGRHRSRDPRPMVFGAAIAVVAMVTMAFLPGAPSHRVAEATPSGTSTTIDAGDEQPAAGESSSEFRACRPPYRDCSVEEPSAADLP
jgi:hypothetical protein